MGSEISGAPHRLNFLLAQEKSLWKQASVGGGIVLYTTQPIKGEAVSTVWLQACHGC